MRILLIAAAITAAPAFAQTRDGQEETQDQGPPMPQTPFNPNTVGDTAKSSVGEVGRRQTRTDIAPDVQPLARINSRIQNRVQNRIRNRIDRYYDPQANTTSPFVVAEDQNRIKSSPR